METGIISMRVATTSAALLFWGLASAGYAQPKVYEEKPCETFGQHSNGCYNCYDGGNKEIGVVFRPNDRFRAEEADRIYFADENESIYQITSLNEGAEWFASNNLLRYSPKLAWLVTQGGNPNIEEGRSYLYFEAGISQTIVETPEEKGIRLVEVDASANDDQPDLRLQLTYRYRNLLPKNSSGFHDIGEIKETGSCIFYYARN